MMKVRPKLPPAYKKIYVEMYKANRGGKTPASRLSQWCEGWMHRQIAKGQKENAGILEIGAGNLNHLHYEQSKHYDIVEPFYALYANSPMRCFVKREYKSIGAIQGYLYDRIISIATFEHLASLDYVVRKTTKMLTPKDILQVAIPNEGCWLWTLGWKLTTGLEFRRKYGLDYGVIMRHEHLNTADEVDAVLRKYYKDVEVKYFGLGKHFSLYRYYECRRPK